MKKAKIDQTYITKLPFDNDRYVGIEIEFYCLYREEVVSFLLAEENLERYCQVKDDGTILAASKYWSYELCILAKETEYARVVRKVCAVIKRLGGKVNTSCGLHVHIDMRQVGRNVHRAFHNLVSAQNVLYAMQPKHRIKSEHCLPTPSKVFYVEDSESLMDLKQKVRYGINRESFDKYQTLEIRIHQGTVKSDEINNWVSILLTIVKMKDRIYSNQVDIQDAKVVLGLKEKEYNYMMKRVARFNPKLIGA